ncbi:MAG TPA: antibiotic biosynthesis monooxygenase [Vicinamibacteria bacterium]|nr:antibiotic biosynthesis monooxygenase [Vicinamibacteria bacterium]
MIARLWHGRTPREKADSYVEYLKKTGVKEQTSIEGNRGDFVFHRIEGDVAHFIVLSLWDSWDAVRRFAGDAPEKAVYYPEDCEYLLAMPPDIEHYEVDVSPK